MLVRELDFMDYFRENLLGKSSATFETINKASKLAGRSEAATCASCSKAEYYELLNYYNRLLPSYIEYLRTKVETPTETIQEPIPDDLVEEPIVKSKKTLK